MINLLELTKKQTIALSAITVALGIALIVGLGVYVAAQSNTTKQSFGSQPITSQVVETQPVKETQVSEDGTVKQTGGEQTVITSPQNAPAATSTPKPVNTTPTQPTPSSDPLGAVKDGVRDVIYTTKNVIPGDPLSYIGTYGQCPFYEDAGAKGCWPPSDIICNANWSVCSYKGN